MMIVQRLDKTPEDKRQLALLKTQEIFQKAIDEHNVAVALADLLGSKELTRGLKNFEAGALELLDLIRVKPLEYELQREVIARIETSRGEISSAIHVTYEKTAS